MSEEEVVEIASATLLNTKALKTSTLAHTQGARTDQYPRQSWLMELHAFPELNTGANFLHTTIN